MEELELIFWSNFCQQEMEEKMYLFHLNMLNYSSSPSLDDIVKTKVFSIENYMPIFAIKGKKCTLA